MSVGLSVRGGGGRFLLFRSFQIGQWRRRSLSFWTRCSAAGSAFEGAPLGRPGGLEGTWAAPDREGRDPVNPDTARTRGHTGTGPPPPMAVLRRAAVACAAARW
ncbi:unnamed protein product [Ixodes persulcatus]|uniref:Uncharacterized protein n=1 Tax=Ixodes scapularis TaxID=6945 RepID=B7PEE5_IXOSC|nr:hypothetical protein IscW_ISCW004807 [Ixodes scapularis]|eukprot:XP_002433567.1 hypothetical protein IscW_ISCW004807 [Ixodes scapularis]